MAKYRVKIVPDSFTTTVEAKGTDEAILAAMQKWEEVGELGRDIEVQEVKRL